MNGRDICRHFMQFKLSESKKQTRLNGKAVQRLYSEQRTTTTLHPSNATATSILTHTHTGTSQLKNSCQDQGEQKILVEYLNILQFFVAIAIVVAVARNESSECECVFCFAMCLTDTPNYAVGFI